METRIAVIGIIIEDKESVALVNEILHQYGSYIIGRMGLPYEKKQVNIISVVVDAPRRYYQRAVRETGKHPRCQRQSSAFQGMNGRKNMKILNKNLDFFQYYS